jgi:3-deoxy-D-manno-octulosonic-acid transferase
MNLLYEGLINAYGIAIKLAAPFNTKARKWVRGRSHSTHFWDDLKEQKNAYWFHCASLGEFEQARPLIEALKEKPDTRILLSFFSPSGFEIRKDYPLADLVVYLPLDTRKNAYRFIQYAQPRAAFFIKYELWPNYLNALTAAKIPAYLVSGIFRKGQALFKPWNRFVLKSMDAFHTLYVQNESSKMILKDHGLKNVHVCGDTRFDRVIKIASNPIKIDELESWGGSGNIMVAGSTWIEDDKHLLELAKTESGLRLIVAPHEVDSSHIDRLLDLYGLLNVQRLSEGQINESTRVVIIDRIGLLSSLYRIGNIAYVGGGFGAGIHNVLEAAVYGVPIIFGPRHQKFQEAIDLIEKKAAFTFRSSNELKSIHHNLVSDTQNEAGKAASEYVRSMSGATDYIIRNMPD